jgi:pilus assembly protein CpaF
MFGKRNPSAVRPSRAASEPLSMRTPARQPAHLPSTQVKAARNDGSAFAASRAFTRSEKYYETRKAVFGALIDGLDLAELAKLSAVEARKELRQLGG